ncbi:MAG: DUF4352 domain-containing protein [Acidobacteria bacterium]|nr:DUF4352 domain-containing protein [Acidobacteriota bacterium]
MMIRRALTVTLLAGGLAACGSEPAAPARPEPTVVSVNRSADTQYFDATTKLTVEQVTLNFYPTQGAVLGLGEGKQFVRVALAVENTGQKEFRLNFTNYTLKLPDGTQEDTTFLINDGNVSDQLKSATLQPGQTVKGALYFEAPATATAATLGMTYKGYVDGKETSFDVALAGSRP